MTSVEQQRLPILGVNNESGVIVGFGLLSDPPVFGAVLLLVIESAIWKRFLFGGTGSFLIKGLPLLLFDVDCFFPV